MVIDSHCHLHDPAFADAAVAEDAVAFQMMKGDVRYRFVIDIASLERA